jgi:hypothetical protein
VDSMSATCRIAQASTFAQRALAHGMKARSIGGLEQLLAQSQHEYTTHYQAHGQGRLPPRRRRPTRMIIIISLSSISEVLLNA